MSIGSDCPKGKVQWATKKDAAQAAASVRRNRGGRARAFRCDWCGCFHVGNKGGDTSKGRQRKAG